jgi:hypothetical protein
MLFALLAAAVTFCLLSPGIVSAQPDRLIAPPQLKHVMLVHYAQPDGLPGKPGKPPPADKVYTHYELIGPKWVGLPVSYVVDPDYGPADAAAEVGKAFEAWDDATSAELFYDAYVIDQNAGPSVQSPDYENVVCWRLIPGYPKAIALTSFWYLDKTGDGMSADDEMQDCDVIFNLKFKWGIDPDGTGPLQLPKRYYDVCNIATHEAGHVTGLRDLYDRVDSEMTMYGYSAARETKKITLEIGDRDGCAALYGP